MQWADAIITKTRRLSIVQQGVFSNRMLVLGWVFETLLALCIIYVPFFNTVLQTEPLQFKHMLVALPFALFIVCYDETRKGLLRGKWIKPESWFRNVFAW
ncbi:hypothetical protein KIPB_009463 [Kipferlia bialata]|uniref:Cation-transporting P-type ATPase C-terminal domain-containing protein n=1 Tax=Kipferlia bialata TaxID=797122 RepID=A0A9K3D3P8_9EUKA|nr:hypothetical protein KIPB_009463 [Kipferlia bialata]|eukprot:g9463.t1